MAKKKMSDGERLVWAATWALEFKEQMSRPKPRMGPDDTYESRMAKNREHEKGCASSAAEHAAGAVMYLRESLKDVRENCGGYTEEMLKEMLAP